MNAYQQVGSFQVVDEHGKLKKNGGNVASYFCTPSGRVIHAVTGPVSAETLLDEARWAVNAYQTAKLDAKAEPDVASQLAQAHRQSGGNGQMRQIHNLLAQNPLPPLQSVFKNVFENVLGEKVSLPGEGLDPVFEAIATAKEQKLPILFALSRNKAKSSLLDEWNTKVGKNQNDGDQTLRQLADSCVVVSFPLDLVPAVSQRLGMRPFAAPDQGNELFVVTRSDGRQLTSLTGWKNSEAFEKVLAMGLVQEAKEHTRTPDQLKHLLTLVSHVDGSLKGDIERLMKQDESPFAPRRSKVVGGKVAMLDLPVEKK